jgi:arylformamidase
MSSTEIVYRNYDQEQLDAQYNNRALVSNHEDIMGALAKRGTIFANSVSYLPDIAFGDDPDEVLDVFPAANGNPNAPVMIYFHGGFWYSRHKNDFQFIPTGFSDAGATVVVVNYGLIPKIDMAELVRQCQASVAWVYKNIADHGGSPDDIYITGHSAGGHVAAMMMATDWSAWGIDGSAIKGGLAISGIYDLEPIRLSFMNPTLGFTEDTVAHYSPIHLSPTITPKMVVAVGGAETDEFIRHSEDIVKVWGAKGMECPLDIVSDLNHFTILSDLTSEGGTLNQQMRTLMGLA